ncbi:MAG TPA: DNA-binding response regulator [Flavobacteriales bacterium]|nr:DNA-binding response regulator [Flavobacteriales bacterium]
MKTILVDDERLARKELTKMLQAYKNIEIIDEAENAEEALDKIEAQKPDLVFLDINMPEKNGFDLVEELIYLPEIIFVTAYDEYAIKAFEVNALDYLLKPVEENRLKEAIEKVSKKIELNQQNKTSDKLTQESRVFLKDGDKCWFVQLKDIRMFESEGNYIRVYFENNKPLILKSLNSLSEKLDDSQFFRANRKFIINLSWVDKIENWFSGGLKVTLKSGEEVEVSRRQTAKFKEMMSL